MHVIVSCPFQTFALFDFYAGRSDIPVGPFDPRKGTLHSPQNPFPGLQQFTEKPRDTFPPRIMKRNHGTPCERWFQVFKIPFRAIVRMVAINEDKIQGTLN